MGPHGPLRSPTEPYEARHVPTGLYEADENLRRPAEPYVSLRNNSEPPMNLTAPDRALWGLKELR